MPLCVLCLLRKGSKPRCAGQPSCAGSDAANSGDPANSPSELDMASERNPPKFLGINDEPNSKWEFATRKSVLSCWNRLAAGVIGRCEILSRPL